MEYISAKAASERYGVTPRWIQKLCEDGKIEGAMKLEGSGVWLIPKTADVVLERKNRSTERDRSREEAEDSAPDTQEEPEEGGAF